MFYGRAVASSTARSLLFLHNMGSSTKSNLFQIMAVVPDTPDIAAEKEAQFSTMLSYKFIEQDGELYKITQKGIDFLHFQGFNL